MFSAGNDEVAEIEAQSEKVEETEEGEQKEDGEEETDGDRYINTIDRYCHISTVKLQREVVRVTNKIGVMYIHCQT